MGQDTSTRKVVGAAFVGDVLVALSKIAAAIWTGSSAMTSEAVHSCVDIGNDLLLLYGMRRSRRPPDSEHPVGYGRELYFWSFIVALLVLSLGAGLAVMQGIARVRQPEPIEDPVVSYVVVALSLLFEGGSFLVALAQYRRARRGLPFVQAVRASKNPPGFMMLTEGGAAIIGLVVAGGGTWAATSLGWYAADGIASMMIGLLLGLVSIVVARESKSLLIGERADRRLSEWIAREAAKEACVLNAVVLFTVQLAPDQVAAALGVQFRPELDTAQIEAAVQRLETAVRRTHPEVVSVIVTPQAVPPPKGP